MKAQGVEITQDLHRTITDRFLVGSERNHHFVRSINAIVLGLAYLSLHWPSQVDHGPNTAPNRDVASRGRS
eukprot:673706-Karenia_brevis.AAC.1